MTTPVYVRVGLLFLLLTVLTASTTRPVFAQTPFTSPIAIAALLLEVDQDPVVHRGSLLATLTGTDLRLVGFFTNLTTPWGSVDLHLGAPDETGEFVQNLLLSVGQGTTSGGLDNTVTLTEAQAQALRDGQLYISVTKHGVLESALRGQLLSAPNEAPFASEILTPSEGATLEIGGVGGAYPVEPATVLGTIAFLPVEDPNANRVAYRWQVSLDADFSRENRTHTVFLGVDGTSVLLTVEAAATLFDALTDRDPGDILLDTPLTVYHRVLTTDGSLYTVSPSKTLTFIRGLITANEDEGTVPRGFEISGNYPNPFNPSTNIVFALPAQADVAVAVYDLMGRQVLALPALPMAAGAAQRIEIDAAPLASGTYLYRIVARAATQTWIDGGQMTLVK